MIAWQCIDVTELPPPSGRAKPLSASLEGKVVLLQAADYFQAKRLLPDLGTWVQCFAIYAAMAKFLMMYSSSIENLAESSNGRPG